MMEEECEEKDGDGGVCEDTSPHPSPIHHPPPAPPDFETLFSFKADFEREYKMKKLLQGGGGEGGVTPPRSTSTSSPSSSSPPLSQSPSSSPKYEENDKITNFSNNNSTVETTTTTRGRCNNNNSRNKNKTTAATTTAKAVANKVAVKKDLPALAPQQQHLTREGKQRKRPRYRVYTQESLQEAIR